jgi:hypothetical protein
VKVYNTLGDGVATLGSQNISVGAHMVQFDAARLANGVYLFRMTAGKFVETKKSLSVR